jgi:uncharacterized membrane-anchored protein
VPDASDSFALNKVATVTFIFWVMKTCATTVGETAGDLLAQTWNVGYGISTVILLGFFVVTLIGQLAARTFHPFLYWGVILSTSTAGTTLSDYMDRTLQLGYATGSAIIATVLVVVLAVWKFTTGSLSVDHISDRKTETFYWFAILASNTLGTALGDYLADSSGLGYGLSNLLISSGIALAALGYYFTNISRTTLFWIAFVLTRPFGATMGDLLTKSPAKGGMGFGTLGASLILLGVLVALIIWNKRNKRVG